MEKIKNVSKYIQLIIKMRKAFKSLHFIPA